MSRSRDQQSASATTASESLVLVKENRFAHAALDRLVRAGGTDPLWLVFLYGPSGVGKSHFVRHFLREARRQAPRLRVESQTTSDYLAIRPGRLPSQGSGFSVAILGARSAGPGGSRFDSGTSRRAADVDRHSRRVETGRKPRRGHLLVATGGIEAHAAPIGQSVARRTVHTDRAARRSQPSELRPASRGSPSNRAFHGSHRPIGQRRAADSTGDSVDSRTSRSRVSAKRTSIRHFHRGAHLQSDRSPGSRSLPQIAKIVAGFYEVPVADLRSTKRRKRSVVPRQVAMLLARELSGRPAQRSPHFSAQKSHHGRLCLPANPGTSRHRSRAGARRRKVAACVAPFDVNRRLVFSG